MNLIEFKPEWLNDAVAPAAAGSGPARLSSRIPIIVAEDEAVSRTVLVAVLRTAGYEPIVTTNGEDAMTALRLQTKACVAIVDWMMPGMDGAEVCRRVRASGKSVHLIMITGRDAKADAVEALDAGADDYLIKPFDRGELLARVRAGVRTLDVHAALSERLKAAEGASPAASAKLQWPL